MGYNPFVFDRTVDEFKNRSEKAEADARIRVAELENAIPELAAINAELSKTGLLIMEAVMSHTDDLQDKLRKIEEKNEKLIEKKYDLIKSAGYPRDYAEPRYFCDNCNDSGYDTDGKMCRCFKSALILNSYEASGIAELLRTQTFESFSLDYYKNSKNNYDKMVCVFEEVKKYADGFCGKNSGNLAFFGGTGLGKTHLSSAVAKKVIDKGYDVMYVTAIELMSDFEQKRFGNSAGTNTAGNDVDRYLDCDLLIIDDLGTEISNQFTVTTLYSIIDTRLKTGKSMLISTNLSPDELRKRYWDRITSRLFGEFMLLQFTGIDVRAQKVKE